MRNYPTIFERAKAYDDGKNGEITPSTHVVINTNRTMVRKRQYS